MVSERIFGTLSDSSAGCSELETQKKNFDISSKFFSFIKVAGNVYTFPLCNKKLTMHARPLICIYKTGYEAG